MKIWANTIVHNEENFIWFALMSVIDYVDKILVWDTGSTDKTVEIIRKIREIKGIKVEFKEVGEVDRDGFTRMRQAMLDKSKCDWILVLDGDEIWWGESIKKLVRKIKERNEIEGIVVPMVVPVGDIYHFQEESAGQYELLGRKGHLSLRAIKRNIPGLHVDWPYGKEGYFDKDSRLVQDREKIVFLNAPFLHVTHLRRSNSGREHDKFKYELGRSAKDGFKFPEVLYEDYPDIVPSPWIRSKGVEKLKARLMTPLRKLKRRLI